MAKYNIIAKGMKGHEYIMTDLIATNLTKEQFETIQKYNVQYQDYRFIPYKDTDFTWWDKISKFLTQKYLYERTYFRIDYYGNVTKY